MLKLIFNLKFHLLGIRDWPNPQSPIPNPHFNFQAQLSFTQLSKNSAPCFNKKIIKK